MWDKVDSSVIKGRAGAVVYFIVQVKHNCSYTKKNKTKISEISYYLYLNFRYVFTCLKIINLIFVYTLFNINLIF